MDFEIFFKRGIFWHNFLLYSPNFRTWENINNLNHRIKENFKICSIYSKTIFKNCNNFECNLTFKSEIGKTELKHRFYSVFTLVPQLSFFVHFNLSIVVDLIFHKNTLQKTHKTYFSNLKIICAHTQAYTHNYKRAIWFKHNIARALFVHLEVHSLFLKFSFI